MPRIAVSAPLLVLLALAAGCTPGQRAGLRGEQSKRDIYLNLMTEPEAERFLEIESEWADDERMVLYCQEVGVWQAWRATPPERQALIRKRQIEVGMTADQVQMAWGRPAARQNVSSAAEEAEGHARELWRWDPVHEPDADDDEDDDGGWLKWPPWGDDEDDDVIEPIEPTPPADAAPRRPDVYLREATLLDGRLESFKDFRDKSLWKKMQFWE